MRRGLVGMSGVAGAMALLVSFTTAVPSVGQETGERESRAVRAPMSISIAGAGGSYLGVTIEDVDAARAEEVGLSAEYGVYVTSVVEDGPAADGGLQEGDVIVRWNGDRVESVAQLQRRMGETPAGRTVSLGVHRDGSDREFSIELGDRSGLFGDARVFTVPRNRVSINRADAAEVRERVMESLRPRLRRISPDGEGRISIFAGRPRLGVSVQSLGDQLAEYFGVDGGALITDVSDDSPAEAAGLRAGDVISAVGGESVEDPGDLIEVLSDLDDGPVEVTVIRDGERRSFTVELEEAENRWQGRGANLYFDRDGDEPAVRFFSGEGDHISIEPVSLEGTTVGPFEWDGFELDRMDFSFDVDGETIDFVIPRIEVPGFELPVIDIPAIEIPGFEFRGPRVELIL